MSSGTGLRVVENKINNVSSGLAVSMFSMCKKLHITGNEQRLLATCTLPLICSEDTVSMILRNYGMFLPDHT